MLGPPITASVVIHERREASDVSLFATVKSQTLGGR